ncbi:MAG TPA: NAD-dependent epimerase/dehydratase family protein, partial [Methanomassiliicoccales archaeon]|nr:NAD-dependent epimerase/dehydratase family protein [Methanomassiliicoccales archaeon]
MKVLVTGATGFLGGYLVPELIKEGHEVFAGVRASSDRSSLSSLGVATRHFDLADASAMPAAVEGMDAVVHLAAYYTFTGDRELYRKLNVEATEHLLQACIQKGVKRFLYCSSTEATGPVTGTGNEDSVPDPQYEYGRSKARTERAVRSASEKGLGSVILRPSGIYGPKNVDDVSYWFITSYGRSFATRFIVGSGKNLIQFVHARDVARAFVLALNNWDRAEGRTFIISDR